MRPLVVRKYDHVPDLGGEIGDRRIHQSNCSCEASPAADRLAKCFARARLVVYCEEDVSGPRLELVLEKPADVFEGGRDGEREVTEELGVFRYLLKEWLRVKLWNERRELDALVLKGGEVERDGAVYVVGLGYMYFVVLNNGGSVVVAPHHSRMGFGVGGRTERPTEKEEK